MECPVGLYTVEEQTTGLALIRRCGAALAFVVFALPFVPLFFWTPEVEGGSGYWVLGILLWLFIGMVLGLALAAWCWLGLPQLYLRCFPHVRQRVRPAMTPQGLDLGVFGQVGWTEIALEYPFRGTGLSTGLLIDRPNALPVLIIEPDLNGGRFYEFVHQVQSYLPPSALPTVSHEGIVIDPTGAGRPVSCVSIELGRHGSGDVLYGQTSQTVLDCVGRQQRVLLHYSGESPRERSQRYWVIGLIHFALASVVPILLFGLFEGSMPKPLLQLLSLAAWVGWPILMVAREQTKPIVGVTLTQWIDLDQRVLNIRSTQHLRAGHTQASMQAAALDDLVLVLHQHQWENSETCDLGLCPREAMMNRKEDEFPPFICQVFSSGRETWTKEVASAIAARWQVEVYDGRGTIRT